MKRRGRGREGKEKMRGRRGIIVGGMVLSLLLGCNNGLAELEKGKESILSISNLRQGFLDVFETFGGMVSGAFGIDANTTKKQVGDRFSVLGQKVQEVLDKIKQMTTKEGESKETQGDVLSGAVNKASEVLTKLKTNLDLLAKIGDGETGKVGEVNGNKQGAVDDGELKKVYGALKEIVTTAETQQVKKEPSSSSVTLAQGTIGVNATVGAKVLTTGNHAQAAAGEKAALIVSAVSGDEMLAEIFKSKEEDATKGVSGGAAASASALAFAKGGAHSDVGGSDQAKASAVAGGIALRSLVKGGKLAANNGDENDIKSVQLVGATAASKLIGAVETLIIKTVNKALEGVKQAITAEKGNGLSSKEK